MRCLLKQDIDQPITPYQTAQWEPLETTKTTQFLISVPSPDSRPGR